MNADARTDPHDNIERDNRFWEHVFQWFVHDIQNPLATLAFIRQNRTSSGQPDHELDDARIATSRRILSLLSVARTLAFRTDEERFQKEFCTIPALLQKTVRSGRYSQLHADHLITFDDELLTARPIRAALGPLREMLSHLVLFCASVSVPDTPIQAICGVSNGETLLRVYLPEPGLTRRDLDDFWIPPERFLGGTMPHLELPDSRHGMRHGFDVAFAIPAALILARNVPCTVSPGLEAERSLVLTVSITPQDDAAQ